MNKKILLSVLIIFSLCLFSGCSFNFFGNKQPNSPEQNNISATDGATSACAAMADGTLTGDRQADIKSACCFKTNLESGACNPGRLVFNTPDLGPVTASVSQGSKTCVVTLTYGNADQIIDPDKKFFANKFIGYSFLLTDLKAVNDPAGCEKNLDLNAFYNFPDDILNKYLGLSSIILGNLDRTKVNALREKQIEKNCSGLSSGALKGDGGAVDKNLACCYQQSFDDGFCFPYQLVFKTADLGKVTLSISSDGENCAARLDFGAAAQITDPAKKFYANKNIIYNKKLSDAKSFGNESFCQEQVNPSSDDFKKFYNLPATLINQYWGSQATAGSGNLIQGLVNSCSAVKNATINGDGSFDDSKGRCCLLENLYLNNCQPFQAAYQTTDLGKVILSISKSKNNCLAKVSYGSADQIADQSKKSFANKTITKIYTPADLKTFGDTQDKTGVLLCQQIFSVYANTSRGDLDLILNGYLSNQPGFSGNLAKSSEVKTAAGDLTGATTKARDHARVSYINSLRQALNDYYMNNGQYPPALSFGQPLKDPAGKNYLPQIAENPFPNDGDCQKDFAFSYESLREGQSYSLTYCLGQATDNLPAGINVATPQNISDQNPEANLNNDNSNSGQISASGSPAEVIPENNGSAEENNSATGTPSGAGTGNGGLPNSNPPGSGLSTPIKPTPPQATTDVDTPNIIKLIQGNSY